MVFSRVPKFHIFFVTARRHSMQRDGRGGRGHGDRQQHHGGVASAHREGGSGGRSGASTTEVAQVLARQTALAFAQKNSAGSFVAAETRFGNHILPVIPRPSDASPSAP